MSFSSAELPSNTSNTVHAKVLVYSCSGVCTGNVSIASDQQQQALLYKGSEECDENTTFDSLLQRIMAGDLTGTFRHPKVEQMNAFLQENEASSQWTRVEVV